MKEKIGRPKEMSSGNRGMNFSVYLDPEVMNVMEEIRWRERKSMSAVIRKAVEDYAKSHAEGNDTFKIETWVKDPTFQAIPTYHSDQQKWIEHYKTSNKEERTRLRIQAINFSKWFRMVDTNK